jgi:hypothetical protein
MSISFARSLSCLDALLHQAKIFEIARLNAFLSRVADGTPADEGFSAWVNQRFPRFMPLLSPRVNWLSAVNTVTFPPVNVACQQWLKLHVLANGREAFCALDSTGRYATGDPAKTHMLDIYNNSERRRLAGAGGPSLGRRSLPVLPVAVLTALTM